MGLVRQLIDPEQFHQYDEDTDAEVEIASSLGAHGCGQRHAAFAHGKYKGALALHDEVGNSSITRSNQKAK